MTPKNLTLRPSADVATRPFSFWHRPPPGYERIGKVGRQLPHPLRIGPGRPGHHRGPASGLPVAAGSDLAPRLVLVARTRPSEILRAAVADIDFTGNTVLVREKSPRFQCLSLP